MVKPSINDKKKTSMRLDDGVIVRKWCESEGHHHVKESWAFSKTRAWSVWLTTLYGRSLTKVRDKLISRHSSKTITTREIRMRYPRNM